jgi:hypothetical protein
MRKKTATLTPSASRATSQTKPAVASALAEPSPHGRPVSEDDIRLCAFGKWVAAGRPGGDGIRFWLDAEQELSHAK